MKIWDQFKSKSLTKQIFLMVSVVFIVLFLVYNSLMIYTKHNRYIEVPNLSGLNLDDAIDVDGTQSPEDLDDDVEKVHETLIDVLAR